METAEEVRERRVPTAGIVVLVAGLALMTGLSWQVAGSLPDPVTLAGTGQHGANQLAPKMLVLGGIPLLSLTIAAVLLTAQRLRRIAATRLDVALWRDDRSRRKAVSLALGVLTPVLLSLHLMVLRAAEGRVDTMPGNLAAAVAVVVVAIGNFWPKQVPGLPGFLGSHPDRETRQRWEEALEAQRRTLRPAGIVTVLLGLGALACSWALPMVSLGICMLAVVAMAGISWGTVWRSLR